MVLLKSYGGECLGKDTRESLVEATGTAVYLDQGDGFMCVYSYVHTFNEVCLTFAHIIEHKSHHFLKNYPLNNSKVVPEISKVSCSLAWVLKQVPINFQFYF